MSTCPIWILQFRNVAVKKSLHSHFNANPLDDIHDLRFEQSTRAVNVALCRTL